MFENALGVIMDFYYSLEIVSIFILGIFLFDFLRIKKFAKASNVTLIILMFISLFISAMSVAFMTIIPETNKLLSKIVISFFYCFDIIAYYLTFLYVLIACGKFRNHFLIHILFALPCIAGITLVIVSQACSLDFFINLSSLKQPNNLYSIYYAIVPVLYMLLSFVYMIVGRKQLTKPQIISISIFSFASIFASVFQTFLSQIILISIARVITVALCYLVFEHPSEDVDSETGFFNKNAVIGLISSKIQLNKKFSLIHINLNNFHIISGLLGYSKANDLLKSVAFELENMEYSNLLFRMERDTFIILDTKNEPEKVIDKIKERFNNSWHANGTDIQLSATIIYTQFPSHFKTVSESLELMSYLSQFSKGVGNHNIISPTADILKKFKRLKEVEIALAKAIENKSLMVYFQPIHDAKTSKIVSAEALVRLKDDKLGFIPPGEFIEIAEKNGSIVEVGNIVFEKTCDFIAKYIKTKTIDLETVEINLSSIQCLQPDLADRFIKIMKNYEISPKTVNLELTESAVTTSEDLVLSHMKKLKKVGVTFSCDDYGTGYSTCSYLLKFPFSQVKFDYSLTRSYFQNPNAKIIMDNEIKTIKALGFTIVAEGIEKQEQLKTFAKLGVENIQGYYFSKPLSESEFIVYYKACYMHGTQKSQTKTTKTKTENK